MKDVITAIPMVVGRRTALLDSRYAGERCNIFDATQSGITDGYVTIGQGRDPVDLDVYNTSCHPVLFRRALGSELAYATL